MQSKSDNNELWRPSRVNKQQFRALIDEAPYPYNIKPRNWNGIFLPASGIISIPLYMLFYVKSFDRDLFYKIACKIWLDENIKLCGGRNMPKNGFFNGIPICFACGELGHLSSSCQEAGKTVPGANAQKWEGRCFLCWEKGHKRENCRASVKNGALYTAWFNIFIDRMQKIHREYTATRLYRDAVALEIDNIEDEISYLQRKLACLKDKLHTI